MTVEDIDRADSFVNALGLLKGRDLKAGGHECVLVAAPIEKIYSSKETKARSMILFKVPCEQFANLLAPDGLEGNDYRLVVFYNGHAVGTNSEELYQAIYAGEELDRIRFSYNEARGALDKPFPDGIKKIYPQTEIDASARRLRRGILRSLQR